MSEDAKTLIFNIYGELKEGNDPERIRPKEIGMTEKRLISAGRELRTIGWLPHFTVTKENNSGVRIWFIGEISPEAMKQLDEWAKE